MHFTITQDQKKKKQRKDGLELKHKIASDPSLSQTELQRRRRHGQPPLALRHLPPQNKFLRQGHRRQRAEACQRRQRRRALLTPPPPRPPRLHPLQTAGHPPTHDSDDRKSSSSSPSSAV